MDRNQFVPSAASIDQLLQRGVRATPEKMAIIARRVDRDALRDITYRELDRMVGRAAAAPLSVNVSETATPTEFSVEGRAWNSR